MKHPVDVALSLLGDVSAAAVACCLERLLLCSGSALGRILVIDAGGGAAALTALPQDPRVTIVPGCPKTGVDAYNLLLDSRAEDVVLLHPGVQVSHGWLEALSEAAWANERHAAVSPVVIAEPREVLPEDQAREALRRLPQITEVPVPDPACVYLRGVLLDIVGSLDPTLQGGPACQEALVDWSMRAQIRGFVAQRANRGFVYQQAPGAAWAQPCLSPEVQRRYPHYAPQEQTFRATLDAQLGACALRVAQTGRLRVAIDVRHLPPQRMGTSVYALCLAQALARRPDVALTLIARHPHQTGGLPIPVLLTDDPVDGFDVIHKPGQLFDPLDLELLYRTPAHLILTHQDLIAHRARAVIEDLSLARRYRALSYLGPQSAQRIIAISAVTRQEIAAELGVPAEEIPVVHHGVDAAGLAQPLGRDELPTAVTGRYFLSVATDYPHKNLSQLLSAYALLRRGWSGAPSGAAPELVLVGTSMGLRGSVYAELKARPQAGVRYLGEVSDLQLRALYQHAEALVYPSLYEGFGLPPLEAMAAGAPVILAAISTMPEVCGGAALYVDGFSAQAMADAMRQVATTPALRERLVQAGRAHARGFTWDKTAAATVAAYREAVLCPSERSLLARRNLQEIIADWALGFRTRLERPQAAPTPGPRPQKTSPLLWNHPRVMQLRGLVPGRLGRAFGDARRVLHALRGD